MGTKTALGATLKKVFTGKRSELSMVPLFVLKDSVVIKRRIDPKVDLADWANPVLTEELKKAGIFKVG